jgi:hypothetical protein
VDDEPLFIIAPAPPVPAPARLNRVGMRLAVVTAVAGLAAGIAIGTAMNHHHGAPATGVTATASK